jgi:accessory gene regulator protein AgrB
MDSEQRQRLADRFARALRRRDKMEQGRQYRQRDVDAGMQAFVLGISKTKVMWIAAVVLALVLLAILI